MNKKHRSRTGFVFLQNILWMVKTTTQSYHMQDIQSGTVSLIWIDLSV